MFEVYDKNKWFFKFCLALFYFATNHSSQMKKDICRFGIVAKELQWPFHIYIPTYCIAHKRRRGTCTFINQLIFLLFSGRKIN